MSFNSKEYNWCDVRVFVLGREVTGIRGVEYKSKKSKEALYGAGSKARSIQHGKREYDGVITLLQSEMIALDQAAQEQGYDDLMDIDMDIVVSYVSADDVVTTDRVVNASITEIPKAMKEGDQYMEIALPFIALDVKSNLE